MNLKVPIGKVAESLRDLEEVAGSYVIAWKDYVLVVRMDVGEISQPAAKRVR